MECWNGLHGMQIKIAMRGVIFSKSVKDVLELNLLIGQQLKEQQTSNDGNSSACIYHISSEGLPLLLHYIIKQIIAASLVDFKRLLQYMSMKFNDFVDAELGKKANNLESGSSVMVLIDHLCIVNSSECGFLNNSNWVLEGKVEH